MRSAVCGIAGHLNTNLRDAVYFKVGGGVGGGGWVVCGDDISASKGVRFSG